jgi:hypothetical protein
MEYLDQFLELHHDLVFPKAKTSNEVILFTFIRSYRKGVHYRDYDADKKYILDNPDIFKPIVSALQ